MKDWATPISNWIFCPGGAKWPEELIQKFGIGEKDRLTIIHINALMQGGGSFKITDGAGAGIIPQSRTDRYIQTSDGKNVTKHVWFEVGLVSQDVRDKILDFVDQEDAKPGTYMVGDLK
jgi:hypothetical protein